MTVEVQIWAQDSSVKGLRLIRFEVVEHLNRPGQLRWRGEIDGPDEAVGIYHPKELIDNGWERLE